MIRARRFHSTLRVKRIAVSAMLVFALAARQAASDGVTILSHGWQPAPMDPPIPLPAGVVCVDINAPSGGAQNGTTWADAYTTIQAAINATTAGKEIWVANGTYAEAVTLTSSLALYGGFQGYGGAVETTRTQRNWTANETIIDGSTAGPSGWKAVHVVTMNGVNTTVLDGFTITGGFARGSYPEDLGGGVFCRNANNTNQIAHCLIRDNSAESGGGIACYDASPTIRACIFRSNSANGVYYGGGLYCGEGGSGSAPVVANCVFTGNSAGGGAACGSYGDYIHPIQNSVHPTLVNCTISGNSGDYGGGVYARAYAQTTLINVLLEGATGVAAYEEFTGELSLTNCLFYNNPTGAFRNFQTGEIYPDSQIEDLNQIVPNATGNVTGDPRFVDKAAKNFRLQWGSAAIDQGASDGAPADDFDGNQRPALAAYDIGAFEYQNPGAGPQAIYVHPASLGFGGLPVNQGASPAQTVTVLNLGGAPLSVTSVTLSGAGAGQFHIASDTGESQLNASETRVVTLAFDPSSTGAKVAALTISSDDPTSPILQVPLTGTGVNRAPAAGLWPVGGALDFDGANDYVDCGNSSVLMSTASVTVEAWINARTWKANSWARTIVGKDQAGAAGYVLRCGGGKLSFALRNSDNSDWREALSAALMGAGHWYHVAGVYDGNTLRVYINGEERASADDGAAPGIAPSTTNLLIGESPGFPGRMFDGLIDEVRVWNVARSQADIQADMYSERKGDEIGLAGYWKFDEGGGSTAHDATANGSDGTLVGPPEWVVPSSAPLVDDDVSTMTEGANLVLSLDGADADGDALTARVAQLPTTGTLYQYDAGQPGLRGALIDSVPTTVSDSLRRVVFAPEWSLTTYTAVLRWDVFDGLEYSDNAATVTVTVGGGTPIAEWLADYLAGRGSLTDAERAAADVNGDGVIDIADLVAILRE